MENVRLAGACCAGSSGSDLLQDRSSFDLQRPGGGRKPRRSGGKTLSKMERRIINRLNIQLALGVIATFAGLTLLFIGIFIQPKGEIHSSVLVAFGEACTFAGALIGVDYHYRFRDFERQAREHREKDAD